MPQAYSDPSRETDPHALPDLEIFKIGPADFFFAPDSDDPAEPGWYWWSCFPGCLPDGEASGPFASEADALDDARSF